MASPIFVDLPADEWTLIKGNITTGQTHLVYRTTALVLETYIQPAGDPAPADDASLGVPVFRDGLSEPIQSNIPADYYLRSVGVDSRVRVDA
jgi:hypothetical protein